MQFSFPLDYDFILRKKRSLKRELLNKDLNFLKKRIAILGGSTTAEIKDILEIFLLDLGILPTFYESEFNKYYEDAVFGNKELNDFKPDLIYIHTSFVNLKLPILNLQNMQKSLDDEISKIKEIWKSLERFNCCVIQNNFELPNTRLLGNLDGLQGRVFFIRELNYKISQLMQSSSNIFLHDINYLSAMIGIEKWFDKKLFYQAKYAMSMEGIVELSFSLSRLIGAIFGKSKKALVLDLDNTCWGGVIGDDGIGGIVIGDETALGESYSAFQQYVLELKQRGIILSVCSKNEFNNAKEGFSHPRSVLKYDDFACFIANWELKNQNIQTIAKNLNIGEDSLVFIDDNPSEREVVSLTLPQVAVPNVGSDVIDFIAHIDRNYYFETIGISSDDLERSAYYLQNSKRQMEQSSFKDYSDFLKSLQMKAEILPFSAIYLDRITQLINKTNQFNCTTKRYDLASIEQISKSDEYITLYGKLIDKYGDNGLIAISIGRLEKDVCHIDLWLMSCRVLKRNMEYAMLDEFIRIAKTKEARKIIGYYIKSAKNNMVARLYGDFGFKLIEEDENGSIWELDIVEYKNKNLLIGVNCG